MVPTLLLLTVSASAGSTPTRRIENAAGPITALAIDGERVVYSTDGNGVYVWNVVGATSRVRRPTRAASRSFRRSRSQGREWAGSRGASAASARRRPAPVHPSANGSGAQSSAFDPVHAFAPLPADPALEGQLDDRARRLGRHARCQQVAGDAEAGLERHDDHESRPLPCRRSGLRPIVTGEEAIVSRSADANRVAVLRADGTVGIYSSRGALLRNITPTSAQEIALAAVAWCSDERQDAETTAPNRRTEGELAASGSGSVGRLQAYGRIALYSVDPRYSDRDLRLLDLKTGKGLVLPRQARSGGTTPLSERSGSSLRSIATRPTAEAPAGSLVFVSTARVLAGIARGQLK